MSTPERAASMMALDALLDAAVKAHLDFEKGGDSSAAQHVMSVWTIWGWDGGPGDTKMKEPIWCQIRSKFCMCETRCVDGYDDDDSFCDCGAVHSGLEDAGRCESCGRVI